MANYQQILDVINQNIKQNGNEEITGNIMNNVLKLLLEFINGEKKGYNGVLTTETRPNNQTSGYWFALEGVYSRFGVSVPENNLGIVYWKNNKYVVDLIDLVDEEAIKEYIDQQLVNINLGFGGEIIDLNQSPTIEGMYIPTILGIYPNFGNLTYLESDGFVLFLYKDGIFSKINIPLDVNIENEVKNNSLDAVNGKAVEKYAVKKINTIAELRNTKGEYEGQIIELLGYYKSGDKETLKYKWTATQGTDDGGSVINADNSSWLMIKNKPNIFDFGCRFDFLDNSIQLQNLINYLENQDSRIINIPSGVIYCNIVLPSNISLIGEGSNKSILKSVNNSNKDVIKGKDFDILTNTLKETPENRGVRNLNIKGLTIDGNKQNNLNGYGIRIWGCSFFWEDLIVSNCCDGGIWTEFTTHEYPSDNFNAVFEALESQFNRIKTISNNGNGWDWNGPHDSEINDYVTFRNKGWGFNQINGSVNGKHWNSWLNYNSFNFGSYFTGDNIVASGEEGIGIQMAHNISTCKITNAVIAGHETGIICRGSLHKIEGVIQNILGNAIINEGISYCVLNLRVYNVKYLYKQVNNNLFNEYNIIGEQLSNQTLTESGNDWSPNIYEKAEIIIKQPSDSIYINRLFNDSFWKNGWTPKLPNSNGTILTNTGVFSESTASNIEDLRTDLNRLLQALLSN